MGLLWLLLVFSLLLLLVLGLILLLILCLRRFLLKLCLLWLRLLIELFLSHGLLLISGHTCLKCLHFLEQPLKRLRVYHLVILSHILHHCLKHLLLHLWRNGPKHSEWIWSAKHIGLDHRLVFLFRLITLFSVIFWFYHFDCSIISLHSLVPVSISFVGTSLFKGIIRLGFLLPLHLVLTKFVCLPPSQGVFSFIWLSLQAGRAK